MKFEEELEKCVVSLVGELDLLTRVQLAKVAGEIHTAAWKEGAADARRKQAHADRSLIARIAGNLTPGLLHRMEKYHDRATGFGYEHEYTTERGVRDVACHAVHMALEIVAEVDRRLAEAK